MICYRLAQGGREDEERGRERGRPGEGQEIGFKVWGLGFRV
jgi:hypothetical protein